MAWEERNGRRYYYHSRRIGGEVIRDYYGNGRVAELMANLVDIRKMRESEQREAERAMREQANKEDDQLFELFDGIQALADAECIAAGYHKHNRSNWRKRRVKDDEKGK